MRRNDPVDPDCGIEQALGVVGDAWSLLVVREVAGGVTRFDALQRRLRVSRKVLTERLAWLVEHGVLDRQRYSDHPPRHDYVLTRRGESLLPVLVALQDWGTRHVLGDGDLTATATGDSAEARRMEALVGSRVPELELAGADGVRVDPVDPAAPWTILFCFPGAYAPDTGGYPPSWGDIPGTAGCTLEARTYATRYDALTAAGARVHGVSTQRPDQLAAFAADESLPYPLLSDQDEQLAAALRLPTFRAGGADRFKRATLVIDRDRQVRAAQFPITDPAGSVDEVLALVRALAEPVRAR